MRPPLIRPLRPCRGTRLLAVAALVITATSAHAGVQARAAAVAFRPQLG